MAPSFGLLIPLLVFVTAAEAFKIPALGSGFLNPYPKAAVDELKTCLENMRIPASQIVIRDDPSTDPAEYEDLNWQWSKLKGEIKPLVYLVAESTADVSGAVRCSTQVGIRIVARSGGHSYVKYGFGDEDSFIVDLQRMNSVGVREDPLTGAMLATVGAGVRNGKATYELWAAGGYLLPLGACPTVGLAGYALGGGYSYFGRLLGTAADNLIQATMVDATGAVLTVNNETTPDLFWALRGGGGGNFGIVTSMEFKTHVVPRWIGVAEAIYDLADLPVFFKSWQTYITSPPPDHVTTIVGMNAERVRMAVYTSRNEDDGGESARTELRQILFNWFHVPAPTNLTIVPYNFSDYMLMRAQRYSEEELTSPEQLINMTRHYEVSWKKVKSFYVDRVLTSDADIAEFSALLIEHIQWPGSGYVIEHYGGAFNRVNSTETAFSHRDSFYEAQPFVSMPEWNQDTELAVEAMERLFDGSQRLFNHTESYQNYLDEDLPDYLRRYYGDNLEHLVAVKRAVDPNNVFHNPLSIPLQL